jgi:hypothetical protein
MQNSQTKSIKDGRSQDTGRRLWEFVEKGTPTLLPTKLAKSRLITYLWNGIISWLGGHKVAGLANDAVDLRRFSVLHGNGEAALAGIAENVEDRHDIW